MQQLGPVAYHDAVLLQLGCNRVVVLDHVLGLRNVALVRCSCKHTFCEQLDEDGVKDNTDVADERNTCRAALVAEVQLHSVRRQEKKLRQVFLVLRVG